MSMVMEIFAVRDATLRRLRDDPAFVWRLIAPDSPELYEQARAEASAAGSGFLGRLFGRKPAAPLPEAAPLVLAGDEGPVAYLDKAWHGLHYLLSGSDGAGNPPLDFLAVGGEAIGSIDVGYGPARALGPGEVAEIARRLAALSDTELLSRYDGPEMVARNIYPEIWNRDDDEEDDPLGYLTENLAGLRQAVSDAATRQQGLVLVLH
jgi:hypothetical protein